MRFLRGALFTLGALIASAHASSLTLSSSTDAITTFHAQLDANHNLLSTANGVALAATRAEQMKKLMMTDAASALQQADDLHHLLSTSSTSLSSDAVESPISGVADIELLCPWGSANDAAPKHEGGCTCFHSVTLHSADGSKKTYRALLPESHPLAGENKFGVLVSGYALGDVAAIRAEEKNHLESADGSKVTVVQENPHFHTKACSTQRNIKLGQKKLLWINVKFPDSAATFQRTCAQLQALSSDIDAFYRSTSFGATNVLSSAATDCWPKGSGLGGADDAFMMPRNTADYIAGTGYSLLRQDAEAAATKAGVELCAYEMEVINFNKIGYGWAGLGSVGGKPAWINGYFDLRVTGHELGHNYGLPHASFWRTGSTEPLAPSGTSQEYGDNFDIMGGQGTAKGHVNIIFKAKLTWIDEVNKIMKLPVPAAGAAMSVSTALLGPMDFEGYGGAPYAGVNVVRSDDVPAGYAYWLSTRNRFDASIGQLNLHTEFKKYTIPGSYFLDLHGDSTTLDDAGLYPGESYSDCGQNIHITNTGRQTCTYTGSCSAETKDPSPCNEQRTCVNARVVRNAPAATTPFKLTVTGTTVAAGATSATLTASSDATYFMWQANTNPVQRGTSGSNTFTFSLTTANNNQWIKVFVIVTDGQGRSGKYVFPVKVGSPSSAATPDYTSEGYRFSCGTGRLAGYVPVASDGSSGGGGNNPVSYGWVTSAFGTCSKPCGGGVATRSVTCKGSDGNNAPNGDASCANSGTKPAASLDCNTFACPTYQWSVGSFSTCSSSCATAGQPLPTQTRSVTCIVATSGDPAIPVGSAAPGQCTQQQPASSQNCNTQACMTYVWQTTVAGECSKTCGGGTQPLSVKCMSSTGTSSLPLNTPVYLGNGNSYLGVSGDSTTENARIALVTATTNPSSVWSLAPSPNADQFYLLSAPAQKVIAGTGTSAGSPLWIATKALTTAQYFKFTDIGDGSGSFQVIIGNSNLAIENTGNGIALATADKGKAAQQWKFVRKDGQSIASSAQVADNLCTGAKPTASQSCNTQACSFAWSVVASSACSATCGGGTQTRTVTCINTATQAPAPAESSCTTAKPATTAACNTQACDSTCTTPCNAPFGKCDPATKACKCVPGVSGEKCDAKPTVTNVYLTNPSETAAAASINPGDVVTVHWASTGSSQATGAATTVNILLWHPNGIAPGYVARGAPNTGSYDWLVNVDHLEGPHYVEVILNNVDPLVKATAQSGTFSILDPCKVLGVNCDHGTCNLGQCKCSAGWTGGACNVPASCAGRTCNGKGVCQLDMNNNAWCNCTTSGYKGTNCEQKDGCSLSCGAGAPNTACTACVCPAGGFLTPESNCATCAVATKTNNCNGQGTVEADCTRCKCNMFYEGKACNWKTDYYMLRVFLWGATELSDEQKGAFKKLVAADLSAILNKPGSATVQVVPLSLDPEAGSTTVYMLSFKVMTQTGPDLVDPNVKAPTYNGGSQPNTRSLMVAAFTDTSSDFYQGESSAMIDTTSLADDASGPSKDTTKDNGSSSGNNGNPGSTGADSSSSSTPVVAIAVGIVVGVVVLVAIVAGVWFYQKKSSTAATQSAIGMQAR